MADEVLWTTSRFSTYTAANTWDAIRTHCPLVQWHKLLWLPKNIPRHSLIIWMAITKKLRTDNKLCSWGITPYLSNLLSLPTRNGNYFSNLLCLQASLCGVSKDLHSWDAEVSWPIGKSSGKSFSNTVRKLSWATMVHYLGQERNYRGFQCIQRPPSS